MQKKLIALAVASLAAGSVFAQSNVAISGYVSGGYANTKLSDGPAANNGSESQVADGRLSRIRFTGTEDLGGGLKAEFQFEARAFSDRAELGATGDNIANLGAIGSGDTFVGLNGQWGRVRVGRIDTYYADGVAIDVGRATSFQSSSVLSVLNAGGATNNGRFNNALRYDSPRYMGFQGVVQYSSSPYDLDRADANNDANKGRNWYANVNYFNGPILAGVSYLNHKPENRADLSNRKNDNAYRVFGSYTFGFGLKVGLAYDRTTKGDQFFNTFALLDGEYKRSSWVLPVSYAMGNHAFYGSYGKVGELKYNSTAKAAGFNGDKTDGKFYSLGYDYALSKRTSIGANYTVLKNNTNGTTNLFNGLGAVTNSPLTSLGQIGSAGADSDIRQIYVGVAHTF